jgi:hypothetical protein
MRSMSSRLTPAGVTQDQAFESDFEQEVKRFQDNT